MSKSKHTTKMQLIHFDSLISSGEQIIKERKKSGFLISENIKCKIKFVLHMYSLNFFKILPSLLCYAGSFFK